MTISYGSAIAHTDLNTEADQQRSALTTLAQGRAKDMQVDVVALGLVDTTALPARSRLFTPQDDCELRALRIYKNGGAGSIGLTVRVTCPNGAEYLLDKTVSKAITTAGTGEEHGAVDYTPTTGDRIWLLKGVQYQLSVESDSTTSTDLVQGIAYFRVRARGRAGRALSPRIFRSGDTFTPDDLNALQEAMKRDLDRSIQNRYTTSLFILPFDDIDFTADGSEEKKIYIKAPLAYDIVAVEWYVAASADTYTLSATNATGWSDLAATATGTTAYVSASDSFVARVAASTEVAFTVSSSGTGTLTNAYAVVHIRHDRHAGSPPSWTPLDLKSASSISASVTAAQVNTSFDNYASAYSTDNTNSRMLRIWVDSRRNSALGATVSKRRLPASLRHLWYFDTLNVSVSRGATLQVINESAATMANSTIAASGSSSSVTKSQGNSSNQAQSQDDPDDSADDWYSYIVAGSGTGSTLKTSLVLYWI